jgi:hypothetical protein
MVTNDGATILKSVYVDNPAAKVLVGAPITFFASHNGIFSSHCFLPSGATLNF